jgi:hypothetical protein
MRQRLRDAEHLIRLGLLFLAGLLGFLVLRSLFVPAGFGELGHFRAGSLVENRERELRFAGRAACVECHDDVAATLAGGGHAGIGCESCHGALASHAADPVEIPGFVAAAGELCAQCHALNRARPAGHPQVDVVAHAEGIACTECHAAHTPAP